MGDSYIQPIPHMLLVMRKDGRQLAACVPLADGLEVTVRRLAGMVEPLIDAFEASATPYDESGQFDPGPTSEASSAGNATTQ